MFLQQLGTRKCSNAIMLSYVKCLMGHAHQRFHVDSNVIVYKTLNVDAWDMLNNFCFHVSAQK